MIDSHAGTPHVVLELLVGLYVLPRRNLAFDNRAENVRFDELPSELETLGEDLNVDIFLEHVGVNLGLRLGICRVDVYRATRERMGCGK